MPGVFDKHGLRFLYPDNWTVEADEDRRGQPAVSAYSPGGAFWTVVLQPAESEPTELAKVALATMRQEYEELDSESVREKVGQTELVGFDVNFYCLDLTNTAWIRAGTNRFGYLSYPLPSGRSGVWRSRACIPCDDGQLAGCHERVNRTLRATIPSPAFP